MRRSSAKKHCLSSALGALVLGGALGATPHALANRGFSSSYKITAESRLAYHAFLPRDFASHRHTLDAEQTLEFDPQWQAVLGLRAYAEGAFAVNDTRFGPSVRHTESSDIRLRDFYLQYKKRKLLLRVGNQQVVWGEAFGFYYADIINPKDLRELGLRDLTAQRLMSPMANAVLFFKDSSLQFLYTPKPYFNVMPAVDGDFSPWPKLFGTSNVTLRDRTYGNFSVLDGELGVRATTLLGGYDLGVFFFTYFDRQPTYLSSVTGSGVLLEAQHRRIGTLGLTLTKDYSQWLLRAEALYTKDRDFQRLDTGTLGAFQASEMTAALEAEYTGWLPWRVALQGAYQGLTTAPTTTLTPRHRGQISANVKAPLWREQTLDIIATWAVHDGSTLTRLQYTLPTSQQFELVFGADVLVGGARSQFGLFQSASRGYVLLKGYLAK